MKTNEFDKPREIPVKPQTTLTPKEIDDRVEKAKEKLHKKRNLKVLQNKILILF